MTVAHRTSHVFALFISIADAARTMGVSRWTAQRMARARRLPGAERMYSHGRGERWHVRRETFIAWQQAVHERVG